MSVDAAHVGYVQKAPAFGSTPTTEAPGPLRAMWRKLAAKGLIALGRDGNSETYMRSEEGEHAVRAYDASLTPQAFEILALVEAGDVYSKVSNRRGVISLMAAGLLHIDDDLRWTLPDDAIALLAASRAVPSP